jgi:aryl-alcohol dehydrogenase-like predicted oxidoreductase
MEYRQLGNSGLRVSALALGTMTFGGAGNFASVGYADFEEASRILDRCTEAGVNLLDTADIYSDGVSEEFVGRLVKGRRDDLVLATKCGFPSEPGTNGGGSSRHHIVRSLDASLRRLQTDYVDLYQLHCWDGQTPLEESLATLDSLVDAGKVRYVGCSNYSAWHVMKARAVADRAGLARFVSNQIYWSLLGRDVEVEVVPACLDQGLGILVWSPLAGGLLTGKYRRGAKPASRARHLTDWNEPPVYDEARTYDIIDAVVEVAGAHNVPPAQVALAWLLTKPALASVIVGAREEAQIVQTLGAAELHLAPEEVSRLDTVSASPLPYPLWHQVKVRDRLGTADRVIVG